ncbi:hypothetical protein AMAG_07612 [Allomyces macrogynus ATCC 38327]|uniref:Uncharacterized protein n=1 Tax=Allomyces macrogynus (strain ATCC 38327) TaxID=578462 RepID=A0A0L0SJ31_ALLM3|nr:hypothetical protein AMAG_07612 [Allomyces macrogynus ATCC 38327]|eukprot:KNE62390.1 hypothetical protein AMAG_07612 [Allomyces macrogynus ATCC 38327]
MSLARAQQRTVLVPPLNLVVVDSVFQNVEPLTYLLHSEIWQSQDLVEHLKDTLPELIARLAQKFAQDWHWAVSHALNSNNFDLLDYILAHHDPPFTHPLAAQSSLATCLPLDRIEHPAAMQWFLDHTPQFGSWAHDGGKSILKFLLHRMTDLVPSDGDVARFVLPLLDLVRDGAAMSPGHDQITRDVFVYLPSTRLLKHMCRTHAMSPLVEVLLHDERIAAADNPISARLGVVPRTGFRAIDQFDAQYNTLSRVVRLKAARLARPKNDGLFSSWVSAVAAPWPQC